MTSLQPTGRTPARATRKLQSVRVFKLPQVKLQKQSAWLSGLSREQAAVASDLLAVWRAGQGVSQRGKPLPVRWVPARVCCSGALAPAPAACPACAVRADWEGLASESG